MRTALSVALVCVACSSSPVATDAAVDSAVTPADAPVADAPTSMCPAALGAARARTTTPTYGPLDDTLRMNQIQMKATHNSYHLQPALDIADWRYSHAPLDVQLGQQGVRGVELDLHWNTECERFEVYHLGRIDDLTTCRLFTQCLDTIRTWSDAHPSHHPLFIHLEPKDTFAVSANEARAAAMEREILSVFPRELIVTPAEVKGDAATVADGVRTRGWPTLRASRGRVVFYIDRTDAFRDAYTHGGRDLDGRLAFVDSATTDPFGAILVLNDPARSADIMAAVRANFIVRVFSWTAPAPDDAHAPAIGLATGAQILSTDFPAMAPGVTSWVEITGGTPSRCNPLNAPAGCTSAAVESLGP
jgi:Phosphoinositide phospholipase C, Ca2+-dependent